jgi:branched-chain amino acid transport system substrate-binding protein
MRHYLSLFLLLVTLTVLNLALAGCAGEPGKPSGNQSPWRTPSGGEIDPSQLPDFSTQNREGGQTPMTTMNEAGRNTPSPYYTSKTQVADLPTVKVALLVPLSGPQANLGQAMLNAAQMAIFDIGASNVTIIPRDTNKGARQAASEAISEGAALILGPLFAQDVKAVSPVAASSNLPVIAFSTDWTAVTDNTYIMGFLPFGQVARVVEYATKHGAKNFAALIPQTPYGMAVNTTLRNQVQRENLPEPQSTIFGTNQLPRAVQQMASKQQAGSMWAADAIMLPLGGPQLSEAATLLRQNDMSLRQSRILGTGLWDDSPQAAALLPGGWYAAPDPSLRVKFNSQYTATYGAQPPRLASLAYDATALAAALAIKGLNETGQPAYDRASITNPSGFSGLDGIFRFRKDGLAERGLAVIELQPSGPVVVDPAPKRF